ncbi:hypothetical protein Q3O60_00420 [Alkalimonas collagenimarina]|uniref:Uncharacterized protein n=1 Tax=Alkalimonas collagenimarina TaxID=400390 RepID=A0ABT9GUD7_9GAMM|nr:hypothetical protein [Alkalimonas collagenimarina]MDP4534660.1 hypothetical protein [Alkalimonas collagenimarina]
MSVGFDSNFPAGGVAGIFRDLPARSPAPVDRSESIQRPQEQRPQQQGIRRSERAVELLEIDAERNSNANNRLDGVRNNSGIAAYQDVANQSQRAEIQSMLGIDLFA